MRLFSNLGLDLKASRVDDLVTIVVNETFSAVANGDVKTQRQSTAKSNITQLAGVTKATGPLANLLNTNTQTQLQGTGETSRGAVLTANLSARVTHVLPNGYLVIEGTKRVQVSSENQVVTVRGVIRPVDLDPHQQHPFQPHRADGNPGQWQGRDRRFYSSPEYSVPHFARNLAVLSLHKSCDSHSLLIAGAAVAASGRRRFARRRGSRNWSRWKESARIS